MERTCATYTDSLEGQHAVETRVLAWQSKDVLLEYAPLEAKMQYEHLMVGQIVLVPVHRRLHNADVSRLSPLFAQLVLKHRGAASHLKALGLHFADVLWGCVHWGYERLRAHSLVPMHRPAGNGPVRHWPTKRGR